VRIAQSPVTPALLVELMAQGRGKW
jgi:hypothetical protein